MWSNWLKCWALSAIQHSLILTCTLQLAACGSPPREITDMRRVAEYLNSHGDKRHYDVSLSDRINDGTAVYFPGLDAAFWVKDDQVYAVGATAHAWQPDLPLAPSDISIEQFRDKFKATYQGFITASSVGTDTAKLEQELASNPGDTQTRSALIAAYFGQEFNDPNAHAKRLQHVLWIIENEPGSAGAGAVELRIDKVLHPDSYEKAKALWQQQVETHGDERGVLENAANFFTLSDGNLALEILDRLQKKEPQEAKWIEKIAQQYELEISGDQSDQSKATAQLALTALQSMGAEKVALVQGYLMQESMANIAIAADDRAMAERMASAMLVGSGGGVLDGLISVHADPDAVHSAHVIRGKLAQRNHDLSTAKNELLLAGKVEGSPSLDTFGPDWELAQSLLDAGESEAVLEYITECKKFWESGQDDMARWEAAIRKGEKPRLERRYE